MKYNYYRFDLLIRLLRLFCDSNKLDRSDFECYAFFGAFEKYFFARKEEQKRSKMLKKIGRVMYYYNI